MGVAHPQLLSTFMLHRRAAIFCCWVCLVAMPSGAQVVAGTIHTDQIVPAQRPMPYPYLREADIVWTTTLWKTIDLREAFNQFIYFPLDQDDRSGKKSLAYVLWEALERGDIPIYEDDDMLVPLDNALFVARYTKADTVQLEIGYDDDDNELYQTVVVPKSFDGAEVLQYTLKEAWFIGRQDTRQDSRRLALAPLRDVYITVKNSQEEVYMGRAAVFWIPMLHPSVRLLLSQHKAYINDNNTANSPSWDNIFVNQVYSAFVTRESNRYNAPIRSFLTGRDAILQAALIEDKVAEIGDEMWEY